MRGSSRGSGAPARPPGPAGLPAPTRPPAPAPLRTLALTALLLAACAQTPAAPAPSASPPSAPAPDAALPTPTPATPTTIPSAPLALGPAPTPGGGLGPAPTPGGALGRALGGLLPPGPPGASATHVTGCAAGGGTATPTRALPGPDEEGPALQVTPTPSGLIVTRRVEHACCLTFEVTTTLVGATVELRERSLGTACRCRCGSTLRTSIALPPGEWLLRIFGAEGAIEERTVRVAGLGG